MAKVATTNYQRIVYDGGNSTVQALVDGKYTEMPSAFTEIPKEKVGEIFGQTVDKDKFFDELVVRVKIGEDDRYFKLGIKAQNDHFGNEHINRLNDKTTSPGVYANILGLIAYINAYENGVPAEKKAKIDVDYFSTMLPVWLVKSKPKFKDALEAMSKRFQGVQEVEILTPGWEHTAEIEFKHCETRIEGEIARLALKYTLEGNPLDSAARFKNCLTQINDLGGQTLDSAKLGKNLTKPAGRDDFNSFNDETYLGYLERFRKEKVNQHFNDVRSLEKFITENAKNKKYILKDPVTHDKTDLTAVIEEGLRGFVSIIVPKAMNMFRYNSSDVVTHVWIGGVAELLRTYIEEFIRASYKEEVIENHYFPENARYLNLYGLEIDAKDELNKKEVKA